MASTHISFSLCKFSHVLTDLVRRHGSDGWHENSLFIFDANIFVSFREFKYLSKKIYSTIFSFSLCYRIISIERHSTWTEPRINPLVRGQPPKESIGFTFIHICIQYFSRPSTSGQLFVANQSPPCVPPRAGTCSLFVQRLVSLATKGCFYHSCINFFCLFFFLFVAFLRLFNFFICSN